ncbi:DUF6461 domain-containing protein [Actinacidiphila glaucinigra]|uniref:DUF6461 domain-containing protein n=1 Tax=Actinacidiphila glaucinigra TaxID=235986 RepID=UPI0033DE9A85
MCDEVEWLAGSEFGPAGVVLARGISPEELARRAGGTPGTAVELTGEEAERIIAQTHAIGSNVLRVGVCGDWAYGVEHLTDYANEDASLRASQGGGEAINYRPMAWHPPDRFAYLRDGRLVCAFGMREEADRYGDDPDHLVPVLVAGGVLTPDGKSYPARTPGMARDDSRRTLRVLAQHFGICMPRESMMEASLPAYVIRGTLNLGPDPDYDVIRTWAAAQGYDVNWGSRSGHVPAQIREAFSKAAGI